MLGAIFGDITGSTYEFKKELPEKIKFFEEGSTFTDDTILTIAVADVLMSNGCYSYAQAFRDYFDAYTDYGYGGRFADWATGLSRNAYHSYGNGSAMRVSPVIWVARDEDEVLALATETAIATHNHPEGIKGAQAIAMAGYMALQGATKEDIQDYVQNVFGYDIEGQVPNRKVFQVSCQDTVPKSIKAFMDADYFNESIIGAIKMGRDTDTLACMTGTIMEPFLYGRGGIPSALKKAVFGVLDKQLGEVVVKFKRTFVDENYDPECELED